MFERCHHQADRMTGLGELRVMVGGWLVELGPMGLGGTQHSNIRLAAQHHVLACLYSLNLNLWVWGVAGQLELP
eukprot:12403962-Karenia_brevis.AAC.1